MDYIELIAVLFTFLAVILTIKSKKLCWPVGIVGIIFYMIVFYKHSLWGNFYLQFIFITQSILGIINWNKSEGKSSIKWVKSKWKMLLTTLLIYPIFFYISKDSSMPYCDSITTTLSVMATGLLIYKKIDAWIYWFLVDIVSIYMFYNSEPKMYLSMCIYTIFLFTATMGLKKWIKDSKIV